MYAFLNLVLVGCCFQARPTPTHTMRGCFCWTHSTRTRQCWETSFQSCRRAPRRQVRTLEFLPLKHRDVEPAAAEADLHFSCLVLMLHEASEAAASQQGQNHHHYPCFFILKPGSLEITPAIFQIVVWVNLTQNFQHLGGNLTAVHFVQ